jgi:glycosyltransferase involved in cell wall biosynthesis
MRADVELRVWIEDTKTYRYKGNRQEALKDVNAQWEYSENISETWLKNTEEDISKFSPDVVFVCGWSRKLPPFIAQSKKLANIPMVLMFDMPWEWSFRKIAARFILRRRLRRFCMAYVPGKSTAIYARWLGFEENNIVKGEYSINLEKFSNSHKTQQLSSRKSFLFIGRKTQEKGLDVLRNAYEEYKRKGGSWELIIPDFIEPSNIPEVMQRYSCLILPSRWEPWGVVVLEAKAAGMKTIVSNRVGSRLDLPVDVVFRSGDSEELAMAMLRIERAASVDKNIDLNEYSVESWSRRVVEICERVHK